MKVSELIELLNQALNEERDIPVTVFCDGTQGFKLVQATQIEPLFVEEPSFVIFS